MFLQNSTFHLADGDVAVEDGLNIGAGGNSVRNGQRSTLARQDHGAVRQSVFLISFAVKLDGSNAAVPEDAL